MVLDTAKLKNRYHIAFKAWRRCRKRVDGQEEHYEGIHDRFLRDHVYRDSQLKISWTEQKCIEMDRLAQKDHSYRLSRDEFKRATSIRLPSCSHNQEPSPPRIRRVIPGGTGTRPKAGRAHEFNSLFLNWLLQLMAICWNRREVYRLYTSHVTFSHAVNMH